MSIRAGVSFCVAAWAMSFPRPVLGADEAYVTVALRASGPNRAIPVDAAFYLEGDVPEAVDQVQIVVLRTATTWLFQAKRRDCVDLQSQLGELSKATLDLTPGLTTTTELFGPDAPPFPAFLPPAWNRGKGQAGAAKFSALVDGTNPFFAPAGDFCVMVYQRSASREQDTTSIKRAIEAEANSSHLCALKFANELLNCNSQSPLTAAAPDSPPAASCAAEADKRKRTCITKASVVRDAALKDIFKKVGDEETKEALRETIAHASQVPYELVESQRQLREVFNSWTHPLPRAFSRPLQLPPSMPAGEPGFARGLALLLEHHGALQPGKEPSVLTTIDGALRVDELALLADGRVRITQRQPSGAATSVEVGTRTDALALPGGGVTLRDLLEFTGGRVRLGANYVSATELRDQLMPLFDRRGALSPAEAALLAAAVESLQALDAALLRLALAAAPEKPRSLLPTSGNLPVRGLPEVIDEELGKSFRPVLLSCDPAELLKWYGPGPACRKDQQAEGWPGFAFGSSPLSALVIALTDLRKARTTWSELDSSLAIATLTLKTSPLVQPFPYRVAFTQESWFFSYVTLVTGFAIPLNTADPFNIPWVGAQLHLVPNPIERPQWSQGWFDLARAFALEVGAGVGTGPWGQDGRFRGWSGVSPVTLALALHLLPYTSVSAGVMLMERRSSPITQETWRLFVSPFVGLNLQINIPDLFAKLLGRTSNSTGK